MTFLGSPPDLLPSARVFIDAYRVRFPADEMKAYDHYGYEATNVLLAALEKVGPDRDKIIAALAKTDHKGVLGETQFDAKGDTLNHRITLFQVKNGRFEPVK